MAFARVFWASLALVVTCLLHVLRKGHQHRSRINRLRKDGVAMPPWSWWFGHLKVLQKALDGLPPDANVYYAMNDVIKEHSDTDIFLMDFWPVFNPVYMLSGPEVAAQVSNTYNLPKPDSQNKSMLPITGGSSLISMNDHNWKFWRSLFNPGFSHSAMIDQVPAIVAAVEIFCRKLRDSAEQGVTLLDDLTNRLTMDIITKTTLDTDLNNQHTIHPIMHALNTILAWHSFWDPRILLNPLRLVVQSYYGSVADKFIRKEIHKRFEEMKADRMDASSDDKVRVKSVIGLALNEYISEHVQKGQIELQNLQLEESFAGIAANQVRLFLFAGNDSTSSSMGYCFHLLFKHPDAMKRLREEHNSVFGPVETTVATLTANPVLLNQCSYTMGVIKEALRLYPPGGSLRAGRSGVSIVDRQGNHYPTDNIGANIMHQFVHVNERFWCRAREFLPERWLVEPDHELYPPQDGSYRPFEQGPRNCIGQNLVYNELRIVLVMTARSFDIQPAYGEFDLLQRQNESYLKRTMRSAGLIKNSINNVEGERAYQTSVGGSHPALQYPCHVTVL